MRRARRYSSLNTKLILQSWFSLTNSGGSSLPLRSPSLGLWSGVPAAAPGQQAVQRQPATQNRDKEAELHKAPENIFKGLCDDIWTSLLLPSITSHLFIRQQRVHVHQLVWFLHSMCARSVTGERLCATDNPHNAARLTIQCAAQTRTSQIDRHTTTTGATLLQKTARSRTHQPCHNLVQPVFSVPVGCGTKTADFSI